MEYCGLGSCRGIMNLQRNPFTEAEASVIIKDSLQGLAYLHSKKLIHRDIKSDNILMNGKGHSKLGNLQIFY
jgi:serine/threonine protein kinase